MVQGYCTIYKGKTIDVPWSGSTRNNHIEDLMLTEDSKGKKLIITKEPIVKDNATVAERLDDLWAVWHAVQSFYLVGDRLPLYFWVVTKGSAECHTFRTPVREVPSVTRVLYVLLAQIKDLIHIFIVSSFHPYPFKMIDIKILKVEFEKKNVV